MGLDLEMVIKEHYSEALDVIGGLFHFIFDGLNQRYAKELAIINVCLLPVPLFCRSSTPSSPSSTPSTPSSFPSLRV